MSDASKPGAPRAERRAPFDSAPFDGAQGGPFGGAPFDGAQGRPWLLAAAVFVVAGVIGPLNPM